MIETVPPFMETERIPEEAAADPRVSIAEPESAKSVKPVRLEKLGSPRATSDPVEAIERVLAKPLAVTVLDPSSEGSDTVRRKLIEAFSSIQCPSVSAADIVIESLPNPP